MANMKDTAERIQSMYFQLCREHFGIPQGWNSKEAIYAIGHNFTIEQLEILNSICFSKDHYTDAWNEYIHKRKQDLMKLWIEE